MAEDPSPAVEAAETLQLGELGRGFPGISPVVGESLAEAASVCLDHHGHAMGRLMQVDGDVSKQYAMHWNDVTEQARRAWADLQESVEYGACGVATLLVPRLTGWVVIERSYKGTGFDYWLGPKGDDSPLFQKKARLEVSGLLRGSEKTILARARQKVQQIKRSNGSLAGMVVIVEFGAPRSRVVLKWKE